MTNYKYISLQLLQASCPCYCRSLELQLKETGLIKGEGEDKNIVASETLYLKIINNIVHKNIILNDKLYNDFKPLVLAIAEVWSSS